jgi:uncharacterized protein (TIGR03790 family)
MKHLLHCIAAVLGAVFLFLSPAYCLSPKEVLVIANMNAADSKGLALYYMEKRQIPRENLLLLLIPDKETCTREAYAEKAVPRIRRLLEAHPDIKVLVTMYGVPLRIAAPKKSESEDQTLSKIETKKEFLQSKLDQGKDLDAETKAGLKKKIKQAGNAYARYMRNLDRTASFDSELSLVKKEAYDLKRPRRGSKLRLTFLCKSVNFSPCHVH